MRFIHITLDDTVSNAMGLNKSHLRQSNAMRLILITLDVTASNAMGLNKSHLMTQ